MNAMIGERIREARLAQERSLADVAGRADISVATLSRIENDKQSLDLGLFLALAQVLQVPAQQLLGESGQTASDHLARRIASLGSRERLELWKDLAEERRTIRTRKRGAEVRQVGQQVEELLAQVDFLREELEAIRKRVKKR
ncbi:MAG TPA: helix-turn-helix domain-containing protein [Thermoanaerobaculia bacterium]|jgi:transcriptional regulator with XRE-family HTH domain|nr:helix-turn-helix domain-containing protein [Thermoanaerobaculia bacterium]